MKKALPLYLIVIATFFLLIADSLCTTGMFMDGLIYNNVAINMAEGTCTFWHPTLSRGLFPEFYEHPPLAMGMLALFFKVFGTSLWVTRLYCMLITALTAYLMVLIWRRMGYKRETGWLPLLLWILVPAVSLNSHTFMLECTMAVFVLAAVLCMIHTAGHNIGRVLWSLLAGVFVFLAFLTKGFTGLYPLVFPLIVWVVERFFASNSDDKTWNVSLPVALLYTLLPVVSALCCFGLVWLLCPGAPQFFDTYFHHQVLAGISAPVVNTRFHILFKFFEQTAIVWAIFVIVHIVHRFILVNKKSAPGVLYAETVVEDLVGSTHKINWARRKWQYFLAFGLLTMAGVLPIMISLKQRSYYILTVYPFFAIALAATLNDVVEEWTSKGGRLFHIIASSLAVVLLVGAWLLNMKYYDKPGREQVMQNDMRQILPQLEEGEDVAMPYEMRTEYSLIGYYYREKRVQLYAYLPVFPQDTVAGEPAVTSAPAETAPKTAAKPAEAETQEEESELNSYKKDWVFPTVASVVKADKAAKSTAKEEGKKSAKTKDETTEEKAAPAPLPEPPADLPLHILTNGTPMGALAPYYQEIKLNTYQYKLYKRL